MRRTVARLALLPTGLIAGSVWASSALAASGTAADAHGSVAANSAQVLGAAKGSATLPFTAKAEVPTQLQLQVVPSPV